MVSLRDGRWFGIGLLASMLGSSVGNTLGLLSRRYIVNIDMLGGPAFSTAEHVCSMILVIHDDIP